jgi:hypothetical protein
VFPSPHAYAKGKFHPVHEDVMQRSIPRLRLLTAALICSAAAARLAWAPAAFGCVPGDTCYDEPPLCLTGPGPLCKATTECVPNEKGGTTCTTMYNYWT